MVQTGEVIKADVEGFWIDGRIAYAKLKGTDLLAELDLCDLQGWKIFPN